MNLDRGLQRLGWVTFVAWEALAISITAWMVSKWWNDEWRIVGPTGASIQQFLAEVGPGIALILVVPPVVWAVARATRWVVAGFSS